MQSIFLMQNNIKYYDITFVVQGPIAIDTNDNVLENVTARCLQSIRQFYPKSKILLSTWEGSNIDGLDYDAVILNKDPGGLDGGVQKWFNNINRMIVTTHAGIEKSTTKYVAKIRADFYFVEYIDILDHYKSEYREHRETFKQSVFKQPILMCMSKSHHDYFLYYISDWFHIGLREDMLKLWGVKLATQAEAEYFKNNIELLNNKKDSNFKCLRNDFYPQFHSEQYMPVKMLANMGVKSIEHRNDYSKQVHARSAMFMLSNFIYISRYNLKLRSNKHPVSYSKKDLYAQFLLRQIFIENNFFWKVVDYIRKIVCIYINKVVYYICSAYK